MLVVCEAQTTAVTIVFTVVEDDGRVRRVRIERVLSICVGGSLRRMRRGARSCGWKGYWETRRCSSENTASG